MSRKAISIPILFILVLFLWFPISMASITPCLADMDTDGDIDAKDLHTISEELALASCDGTCLSDLDRDGSVEADDIRCFAEGFGRISCPEIDYRLHGLNFSPYMDGQDPNQGSVVSEDQIRERMQIVAPFTDWVRSFGTTNGLGHIGPVTHDFGLNTAIGAWLSDDVDENDRQITNLIAAALNGEADLAIVGSEVLLRGDLSAAQLIAYINQFKAAMPGIPVTTADVYSILIAHPAVMAACDVILANYYPFWECLPVEHAMARIHDMHQQVVMAAPDKQVIVSEAGWPSDGEPNCAAVPSLDNACDMFANFISWARAEDIDYFYFEAFDESWKVADEGEVGAHWGIWDKDGFMKDCMDAVFFDISVPDNWSCQTLPGGPGTPDIQFSYVPPYGGCQCKMEGNPQCRLYGKVEHVPPGDYNVAVYIRVGSGWWTKPTWANPVTPIDCRGLWGCNIVTGGNDTLANAIAAFLIPAGYTPPSASGQSTMPDEIYENSVAHDQAIRIP
jgi:exo-beta-1,3-glucanase (GH17 family)